MIVDPLFSPLSSELPPVDDHFFELVRLELGNLVGVGDELGAQTLAVEDDQVAYAVRGGAGPQHWRGRLGACGLQPC